MATTYYIDLAAGDDTSNDGTSAVKTNGDGPWKTFEKFTNNVRVVGDIGIVRRGTTETNSATDITINNDGSNAAPITLTADYVDAFGDDVSSDQTYTPVLGAKTMEASASITTLVAGEWIYVVGDDAVEESYEVASVSGTTLTLYFPYKGGNAGSGKTLTVMLANPIFDATGGTNEIDFSNEAYWHLQGIEAKGEANYNGIFNVSGYGSRLINCTAKDSTARYGFDAGAFWIELKKCRVYNRRLGIKCDGNGSLIESCYVDCNSIVSSSGFSLTGLVYSATECEAVNATTDFVTSTTYFAKGRHVGNLQQSKGGINDFDGTVGDHRGLSYGSLTTIAPKIRETTTVHSGGGDSIKITPGLGHSGMTINTMTIFEYPIYIDTTASKTYTVYVKTAATTDWTANPTATEFWLELEAYCNASNAYQLKNKSTGTVSFTSSTDWQTLTVTVSAARIGTGTLRLMYKKNKEGGKSNVFFVDMKPVIS